MKEGNSFKVTTSHRSGLGVEAEAQIKIAGLKTKDRIRVSVWDPPRALDIEHLGWVKGLGAMRCYPSDSGTHLFWKETLVPPWGLLGAVGIRMFKHTMRKIFQRDLLLLKKLVEDEYH